MIAMGRLPAIRFEAGGLADMAAILLVAVTGLLALRLHQTNLRVKAEHARAQLERDRADASLRGRDELVGSVWHAMRTRLSVIQMSVYALGARGGRLRAIRRERVLANLATEADHLSRMVEHASALVQLEDAPLVQWEWNDFGDIVWAAVQRCLPLLGDRPLSLTMTEDLPLARFDALLLDQAIVALLENVAVHTPAGSPVWIDGQARGTDLYLTVTDAGPGVPPDDRERIFANYRHDNGRGPGVGLGLAVARAAIRAQGGRLWAEDSPDGGARFVIVLPQVEYTGPN